MFRASPARVAIGIGSNLGDRHAYLRGAAAALTALLADVRFSGVYRTEPVGRRDQPAFLNACAVGRTSLPAPDLLAELKAFERAAGRRAGGPRWGPRVLDLDILLYDGEVVEEPGLRIPHPRLARRAFALVPLREIAPEWVHPVHGVTIGELAARVDASGVERTELSLEEKPGRREAPGDEEGVRG